MSLLLVRVTRGQKGRKTCTFQFFFASSLLHMLFLSLECPFLQSVSV